MRAQEANIVQRRDGLDPSDDLIRTRETLTRLAQCTPVMLLVQSEEVSDEGASVSTLRAWEHRLTAYTHAIEQYLDTWEEDPYAPDDRTDPSSAQQDPNEGGAFREDVSRRSEDLRTLQVDLEAVVGAVELFLDHPDCGDNLSVLEARLGEAEERLAAIVGELAVTTAAIPQGEPLHSPWHHHRPQESRSAVKAGEPRPSESDQRTASEKPQHDTTSVRSRPDGIFGAMQDLELAALDGRVRRLESRVKLGTFLLVIIGGLVAAFWWWSGLKLQDDNTALDPESGVLADGPPDAGNALQLPTLDTSKPEVSADGLSAAESEDPWIAVQRLSERVESLEAQIVELSLRTTGTNAPPGDAPEPKKEVDAKPPGIDAEPAENAGTAQDDIPDVDQSEITDSTPDDVPDASQETITGSAPDAGQAGRRVEVEAPPPQDEKETESTKSPDSSAKDSTMEGAGTRTLEVPRYGVQLVAFKHRSTMSEFVHNTKLGDNAVYALASTESGKWYIVLKGFYPNRNEARKAAEALPPKLKSFGPWVKRYPAGMTYYEIE